MFRDRIIADVPGLTLVVLTAGLGVLSSVLVGRFGILVPVGIVLLFASALLLPLPLHEAVDRFRVLKKQLTWWHGLLLLVFLSGFQFRNRDTQTITHAAVDSWASYRIALMAITAFVLGTRVFLRRVSFRGVILRSPVGALALYAVICLVSTLWSVFPLWTLYKSLEYLVDVALLAAILATCESAESYKSMFDWTWTLYGFLLVTVWLGTLLWPGEALQPSGGMISVQLYGVVPLVHTNSVGDLGAIVSIVALSRLLRMPSNSNRTGRAFYGVLVAFGLAAMAVAQTRSAILGFLLGLALLLYFSRRTTATAFLIVTLVLLFSLTSAGAVAEEYLRRGQSAELVRSLSGRTGWWESGWQEFLKSPWTGTGAYTARFTVLEKLGARDASTIHNTYLETLLGVGILGVIPVVAVFLWTWTLLIRELRKESGNAVRRQLASEAIAILAILTCTSVFSVALIVHPDVASLAVLGYAELLRRSWKGKKYSAVPNRYQGTC